MKKLSIIMMFVALFATTSCSSLTGATDTTAIATGTTCAKALIALRSSYKAGTLSLTNLSDLSNMLIVANAYTSLKANKENANYKKSFSTGMVAGGSGAITNSNVATIVNLLMNANALGTLNNNNATNSTTEKQTTGSVIPMFDAMK